MQSFHDQGECPRPGEVEGEPDGVRKSIVLRGPNQTNAVFTQNWRDDVPIRARRGGIDLGLVVLQTDPEPRSTRSGTRTGIRGWGSTAALTSTVLSIVVDKRFQPQLEHPGATDLIQSEDDDNNDALNVSLRYPPHD